MTDPAVNALALQLEFGDDEMKKAVDAHIREVVAQALNDSPLVQAHIDNLVRRYLETWMTTNAFRRAVNDAMIRNMQYTQTNGPY